MERAPKAYKNLEFLNSRQARTLRILAEYLGPEKRFHEKNIKHTVAVFGSSRINIQNKEENEMRKYYLAAEEFAFQLATWGHELAMDGDSFTICSGGGPGIMEATNKGAQRAHSLSIGLNVSLPHEQEPNDYITPELNFEFHYFFMRKLWFLYYAKAVVLFPGGFGTLDELFETLTLIQTQKIHASNLLILLYDQKFWEEIINFKKLIEHGLISAEDVALFHYFDSVDQGLDYLKPRLKKIIREFRYQL
ncbi:LOG family protein [candidate division CSSED10-310 bacterium]|uniref:LOG family protein n=1 Tax=candidate division CSSED10-310 bacterium TaxID=2855610 RepID=A0ABV6Z5X0_UNCC1